MPWVYRPGHPEASENGMVDRGIAGEPLTVRSTLSGPMLIRDNIEIQSQVDGRIYTSKAKLRQSYRANGYVEIGNEVQKPPERPKPDKRAIKDTVGRAFNQVGISTC